MNCARPFAPRADVIACSRTSSPPAPPKGTKIEAALQGLKGVSSVAYTSGDPVALAKALADLGGRKRRVHL